MEPLARLVLLQGFSAFSKAFLLLDLFGAFCKASVLLDTFGTFCIFGQEGQKKPNKEEEWWKFEQVKEQETESEDESWGSWVAGGMGGTTLRNGGKGRIQALPKAPSPNAPGASNKSMAQPAAKALTKAQPKKKARAGIPARALGTGQFLQIKEEIDWDDDKPKEEEEEWEEEEEEEEEEEVRSLSSCFSGLKWRVWLAIGLSSSSSAFLKASPPTALASSTLSLALFIFLFQEPAGLPLLLGWLPWGSMASFLQSFTS